MLAYSPPVVPRSSVVNYAGPQVLDQSERKKIGPKHFVMLTVSSEELARVRNERRRVELNRPSFLLAQLPQIGSRGDIQPCEKAHRSPVNSRCLWTDRFSLSPRADIALSIGLMKDGHRCTIVTHDEFKPWIECEPPPFFRSKHGSRFADPCLFFVDASLRHPTSTDGRRSGGSQFVFFARVDLSSPLDIELISCLFRS